jgi:hypothetical protein
MKHNAVKISTILEVQAAPAGEGKAARIACTAPVSLSKTKGRTVTCVEGCLWLTVEGDPVDHILSAGQSLSLADRGSVVLSPLPKGSYLLA